MTTDVTAASSDGLGTDATFASGSFTSDGNATSVTLGFVPRWVKVINSTDVIVWEKIKGMAAANSIKTVTAGTTTVDTGSAITFPADTGLNEPGNTMLLSSTLCGTSKAISWVALG